MGDSGNTYSKGQISLGWVEDARGAQTHLWHAATPMVESGTPLLTGERHAVCRLTQPRTIWSVDVNQRLTILQLCAAMRALTLLLVLIFPLSAQAESYCSGMNMPTATLTYISRGFSDGHTGLDLMAPRGSPIRAAAGGTVISAGWYFDYGNIVDIKHADGVITRYAHMLAFARGIGEGTPVSAGKVIGQVGATGRAHGPHVHFEVRLDGHPVDPRPYLGLSPCTNLIDREPIEEARSQEPKRRHP